MNRLLLSLGLLGVTAFPVNASPPPTALSSLQAFARERGNVAMSRVVGVVGFYGQNQPRQWLILSIDPKVPNLMHEFVVRGGRVVAERHFGRAEGQDLPYIPLPANSLKVDSNRAFTIAEGIARKEGIGFDSLHYQLRCRDLRHEPVWVLNLMDQRQSIVGVLYISAMTGETLRGVCHRPGTNQYTDASERGFFGKLKDGVTGIFKRDKKKSAPAPTVPTPIAAPSQNAGNYAPPPPPRR